MTPIERMARAIWRERYPITASYGAGWSEDDMDHCIKEARAALDALMEPSEAMLAAGAVGPRACFRNMIQAAKDEGP